MITTLPPIVGAARKESVYHAALAYSSFLSVIPCFGKRPSVARWKEFQRRRADPGDIVTWNAHGLLVNVGIVCGWISGNLVVLDLDGPRAVELFSEQFPQLLDTYTVQSGSGQGAHLYYFTKTLPPTTRVTGLEAGNVELRANGCYVVAPPSIHPSGKAYTVTNPVPVLYLADLEAVVKWIGWLKFQQHGDTMAAMAGSRPIADAPPWAAAALAAECAAVRAAPEGARNNTLNRAAFKMGQLVRRGMLSRDRVEQYLFLAAATLAISDGDASVLKTIKSGLDAGMSKPSWRTT